MKLIELLLVIAIISVLLALSAPATLKTFRDKKAELKRIVRGHDAKLALFARDEAEETQDPRLREIRARQELQWLGGR